MWQYHTWHARKCAREEPNLIAIPEIDRMGHPIRSCLLSDRSMLRQVFANLLGNAVKYTGDATKSAS